MNHVSYGRHKLNLRFDAELARDAQQKRHVNGQKRKRVLQMLIGLAIAIPYIFVEDVKESLVIINKEFTILAVLVALIIGTRAFFLIFTSPSDWVWSGELNNIARLKEYRNGLLSGMDPRDGSQLLRDTQALDMGDGFGPDTATGRARTFLNGQLAGMSPAQGIEFMKGNRK